MSWPRFRNWFRTTLLLAIAASSVVFVLRTWHWPLVGDAPLMHYVVFLMEHGRTPYRDIVDINMPGTYLVEGLVMHLLGGGSLAWRLFDLSLLAASAVAMVAIAWPCDWFAGIFAASIFMFIHGRDGLIDLGQRDLVISVLILAACALLFHVLRSPRQDRPRIWATALFGLSIGIAATIKPTAMVLGPALLLLAAIALRRRNRPILPHISAGAIGLLLPWAVAITFLAHDHALQPFLRIVLDLVPDHAGLRRRSASYLLLHGISSVMLPLVLLWLPVAWIRKSRRTWEGAALYLGVLFGLFSFFVQGKAYPYHRYPSEALLLLLIGIDFTSVLRAEEFRWRGTMRALSLAGLAFGVLVIGLGSMLHALRLDWRNQEFDTLLQADLRQLGGPRLTGQVQCLDMAAGCLNTLYRMQLVQATGFLYDCYLLAPDQSQAGEDYRRRFLQALHENPPAVFIVTSHQCGLSPMNYRYDELHGWPQFDAWLSANYGLYRSRIPHHLVNWEGKPAPPFGYRIYLRRGCPATPAAGNTLLAKPAP